MAQQSQSTPQQSWIINECDCYELYNDIQLPSGRLFVDIRAKDKYKQKHIKKAINIPIDASITTVDNIKSFLYEILEKQSYVIDTIWFYGDDNNNNNKLDNDIYKDASQTICNVLLSKPSIQINILKDNFDAFDSKFPYLCEADKVNNNSAIESYPSCIYNDKLYIGI